MFRLFISTIVFSFAYGVLAVSSSFAADQELYVPYESEELAVDVFSAADSNWRLVWMFSQYESLMDWEREVLKDLQQQNIEIWAVDLLSSLFLTRTSESARSLAGGELAAVLQAAEEESAKDGKGIILLASDRMAGAALKGVRSLQEQNLGQPTNFKGTILAYPSLYKSRPIAGESANWEEVVSANQAPVVILQPEQGVHRWYLGELMEELNSQGAASYGWILPQVKDYFISPFEEDRTAEEAFMTDNLASFIDISARTLARSAGQKHPEEMLALEIKPEPEVTEGPKLHKFAEPQYMPELKGEGFSGEFFDLEDYKGKVVLVNFWATWCPPCVTEIPSMNRLLDKYQDQGLEILSVDFQQSAEVIQKFVDEIPVDYPIVLDLDGTISKRWSVFSFPTTFVVDKSGKVVYSLNQSIEWDIPEMEEPLLELMFQ